MISQELLPGVYNFSEDVALNNARNIQKICIAALSLEYERLQLQLWPMTPKLRGLEAAQQGKVCLQNCSRKV